MKTLTTIIAVLLLGSSFAFAQELTEEQKCAQQVRSTVAALESTEKLTGIENTLHGLSVNDILFMQKNKGSCPTMQEINKRIITGKATNQ